MSVNQLEELRKLWLEEKAALAASTKRSYDYESKRFVMWACRDEGISLDLDAIAQRFLVALSDKEPDGVSSFGLRRPLKATSLQQAKRIVVLFITWAIEREKLPGRALRGVDDWAPPEEEARESTMLSRNLIRRLRLSTDDSDGPNTLTAMRRDLFVALSFWLCMTPKELSTLVRSDFSLVAGELRVRVGANGTWQQAPAAVRARWLAWEKHAPKDVSPTTPLAGSATSLTTASIGRIVRQAAAMSAKQPEKGISCRLLRRIAMLWMRENRWTDSEMCAHLRRKAPTLPPSGRRSSREMREALSRLLDRNP